MIISSNYLITSFQNYEVEKLEAFFCRREGVVDEIMSRARDLHLENEVVHVRFTQVLGLICAPENGAAAESRSH